MSKRKITPEEMAAFADPADTEPVGELGQLAVPAPQMSIRARHNMEMAQIEARIEEMIEPHGGIPERPDAEMLLIALKTSMGVDEAKRAGFRGMAVAYAAYSGIGVDPGTGELGPCAFLSILTRLTGIVRLSGWSAISTWAGILRAVGEDRLRAGIPIVVRKRASSTVGRSYWVVEIDAAHEIGG